MPGVMLQIVWVKYGTCHVDSWVKYARYHAADGMGKQKPEVALRREWEGSTPCRVQWACGTEQHESEQRWSLVPC